MLRLLGMLPDDSAMHAHLAGEPVVSLAKPVREPWREWYGWGADRFLAAAQWNLLAAVNTPKGKTAQKYPTPGSKPQGTRLSDLMPQRRQPVRTPPG